MKKICTAFLAAVMAIFMVCATACGDSDSGSSGVTGTWKLDYDTSSMTSEEAAVFNAFLGRIDFELTFNSDGTGKASGSMVNEMGNFTWTQNGETITLVNPEASKQIEEGSATGTSEGKLYLRNGKLYFDEAAFGAELSKYAYMVKK